MLKKPWPSMNSETHGFLVLPSIGARPPTAAGTTRSKCLLCESNKTGHWPLSKLKAAYSPQSVWKGHVGC